MRFRTITRWLSLTAVLLVFAAACSGGSDKAENNTSGTPPASTSPGSDQLSSADTAKAIAAVKTNWDTCLSAVGVSSSSATVAPIDDTKTGRPIDKGNHPVVVHVQ